MTKLFQPTAQLKISLTADCNNQCSICLNKTTRGRNGREIELSIEKIKEVIDEASSLGMVGTYWTGGEPLIEYNNLLQLIEYSSIKGLIPTVVTNGGLIGAYGQYKEHNKEILLRAGLYNMDAEEIAKSLMEAGLKRIYFSVDSNHTTLEGVGSKNYTAVPTQVVSKSIQAFLNLDFGKIHDLEAIGHQLRITATSSGVWEATTNKIIDDVINQLNLKLEKEMSSNGKVYSCDKGQVFFRKLGVSSIGDAEGLHESALDKKRGKDLFGVSCPHFIPRKDSYDNGKHHRDLYIDFDGIVYTCGNHAYPVGNVFEESLTSIINGVNQPKEDSKFYYNRRVFHSLLSLAENEGEGSNAIGKALRMIYEKKPSLVNNLSTQCGSCNQLGKQKELQTTFLEAYETNYVKKI